jgi:hypothetical protein
MSGASCPTSSGGMSGPNFVTLVLQRIPGLGVVLMSGYPDEVIRRYPDMVLGAAWQKKPFGGTIDRRRDTHGAFDRAAHGARGTSLPHAVNAGLQLAQVLAEILDRSSSTENGL